MQNFCVSKKKNNLNFPGELWKQCVLMLKTLLAFVMLQELPKN